jgi:hypothetical protein
VVAEQALGRQLPPQAIVHHVNDSMAGRSDNRGQNLVICENRSYHNLLHQRLRAYRATGDVTARKCWVCKRYDSVVNLVQYRNGKTNVHVECSRRRKREHR